MTNLAPSPNVRDGLENIKSHFGIEHIVSVSGGSVRIGSEYILDLILVKPDGTVEWGSLGELPNELLLGYYKEMSADQALMRHLIESPDVFSADIPVYYFDGEELKESKCEALGWPNTTHDGVIMHENVFFATRQEAIDKERESLAREIPFLKDLHKKATEDLLKSGKEILNKVAFLKKLDTL